MDRLHLLAPALLLAAFFIGGFAIFATLYAAGRMTSLRNVKHNEFFGPFFGAYLVWMLGHVERLLVGRVSANTVTAVSLLLCAACGVAAATGHLAFAVWLYVFGGILDALDGRLARLNGEQTTAGALFDSVSDRWGELFVFTGYIWLLHDSPWMLAAVAAIGTSQMVSYTRARAEGLGLTLKGGVMQRAERIVLVAGGTLVAAWYGANPETAHYVVPILGGVMLVLAVGSAGTALNRWIHGYRELSRQAAPPIAVEPEPSPRPAAQLPAFPVPQKLRESAELAPAAPRI